MERGKWLRAIGLALIVSGLLALVLAVVLGEADVVLFVIIPVIYGGGPLGALAILVIFAGVVVLFLSYAAAPPVAEDGPADDRPEGSGTKREFGGVVLIGPIPIVFGSARSLRGSWALAIMAALTIVVLMLFLFILLR
jgi:uncharacterized protein (TIGR00304 family)